MKIETSVLKSALDIAKLGLTTKGIIEQTNCFAFIDGCVVTYNDEVCVTTELKIEGLTLEGVIKADEMFKFLSKVKDKEIDVNVTDDEVVFKAGRAKVGFSIGSEITLPLEDVVIGKGKWKDLPEGFLDACKFTAATASNDSSDPILLCVNFKENGTIEASNNQRLVVWTLKDVLPIPTSLIPASSVKDVVRVNPTQIATGTGWVHFKNDMTTISCRVLDESFVNTAQILNQIKKTRKMVFPDGLIPILEKAEVFTLENKLENTITLEFKSGRLTIKAESTTAWFKESIAYEGKEEFAFTITPYLLRDILKQTNTCLISGSMMKFSGEQWIYVTMIQLLNE